MGTQHNKLDSDGQRLRRYEIIRFIKDNGPVKASAVMERFGIKKQAFYDDLGEINIRGDVIVYTGKNMYAYNEDHHITGELLWKRPDKAHLRSWFALLCLSSKPSGMTAKELLDRFKEAGIRIGNTSANGYFYSLLLPLIKEGLIKKVEKGGTVRYVSDALRFVDSGKALAFLENAGKNDGRVRIESLGRIEEKIRTSFPDLQVLVKNGSVENGKKSVLTQEQSSFLRTLSDFGFTESAVDITYRTRGGSLRRCVFCTGLCVFDIDTGGLYLIGRSDDGYDTVIPADSVISDVPGICR